MDLAGNRGVTFELQLSLLEIVIGLSLLKRRLPILPDHHEGRQEDSFQRHYESQLWPRILLQENHPQCEYDGMNVHKIHRTGERSNTVGQTNLEVLVLLLELLEHGGVLELSILSSGCHEFSNCSVSRGPTR